MAKNKKTYLNNYQKSENGKYIYNGVVYANSNDKATYKQIIVNCFVLSILSFLLSIMSGCLPVVGMNSLYSNLPYIAEVGFSASLVYGTIKLYMGKGELKEHIYKSTIENLPRKAVYVAVFGLSCLVVKTVYVFMFGFGESTFGTIMYLIENLAIIIFSLLFMKNIKATRWTKYQK